MVDPSQSATVRSARPGSYCSVSVSCLCETTNGELKEIGTGTGFFYRVAGKEFLVTNWHVLTGRNPEKPEHLLPGFPQSPTHIRWHQATKTNRLHFLPTDALALYDRGKPVWIEAKAGHAYDLACIPIAGPSDALIVCVQDLRFETRGRPLEVGMDVVVIGFPFPLVPTNPFPVWKRAMVASEPAYSIGGKWYAFLDTPARPGMSGSPVYATANGFPVTPDQASTLLAKDVGSKASMDALLSLTPEQLTDTTITLNFVGVYSGAYGEEGLERMGLGRFWPAVHLERLFLDFTQGTNPFPPP